MSEYPTAIKNFLELQNGIDKVVASHPNDRADEITAIETFVGASGAAQSYNAAMLTLLKNYIQGCKLAYIGDDSLTVESGEALIPNVTTGKRLRVQTSNVTADTDNLDSGSSFANSTTYYVYLTAEASGTGWVVSISTDDTSPDGFTYYKRIGTFVTDGSGDILEGSISNVNGNKEVLSYKSYDSGWFAISQNTQYTKTHSLGTTKVIATLYFSTASDGSANFYGAGAMNSFYEDDSGATESLAISGLAENTIKITMGYAVNYPSGNGSFGWGTSGYARLIILALE